MSKPQDNARLPAQPLHAERGLDHATPEPNAARQPWTPPAITSSGIFHGVVLATFNPAICGASS